MTTTIVPTAPSFVAASQIKAGKLASSSRVAISSINLANWLCVYGSCNITFLGIAESPDSSILGHDLNEEGHFLDLPATTATYAQDFFIVGKRENAAGVARINTGAQTTASSAFVGSVDEGVSVYRTFQDSVSTATYPVYAFYNDYSAYITCGMSVPNYQSTSGMIEPARSSTQPIVSAFEDDAIGHAADGGSLQGAADIIKRAWGQHCRCAFSSLITFRVSTGYSSSWTNLVDHISGTSGYEIQYRGRQLYAGDTTATLHVSFHGPNMGLEISSSKEYITVDANLSTDSSTLLVDCLADDSIRVAFRNVGVSTVSALFNSIAMLEWYSSGVE